MEMLLKIILGIIFYGGITWFIVKKIKKKKKTTLDIIDNDPELKKLNRELGEINEKSLERLKKTDSDFILLMEKQGLNPLNLSGEELEKKIKDRIINNKNEQIKKIEEYCNLGYINKTEKQTYITNYIENKTVHIFPEHNFASSENMKDTDENLWGYLLTKLDNQLEKDKKRFNLSKKFGKNVALKLINQEVWLGMTQIELMESRGLPNDKEKELTTKGQTEIYIYGNKKTGSYFTFQDGKLIKIMDRDKK